MPKFIEDGHIQKAMALSLLTGGAFRAKTGIKTEQRSLLHSMDTRGPNAGIRSPGLLSVGPDGGD